MTKHRIAAALAASICALGAAAAVKASIPDASGVIHGCYNTSLAHGSPTGALRLVDTAKQNGTCASWETPVSWNSTGLPGTTGPTGPTGERGPTGARGPTGSSGSNDGWFNTNSVDLPANGNDVTEASLTLSVGSFMLFGQAQVFLPAGAAHCFLQGSGGTATVTGAGDSVALDDTAMAVNGAIIVTAGPATVDLVCFQSGAGAAVTARGALSAVQVATIH